MKKPANTASLVAHVLILICFSAILPTQYLCASDRIEQTGGQWPTGLNDLGGEVFSSGTTFLGGVELYQKNGLVEVYGGTFRQWRAGPIRISRSTVLTNGPETWVIWSPDSVVKSAPSIIRVQLGGYLDKGSLSIGLITRNDRVYRWETKLGVDAEVITSNPIDLSTERRTKMLSTTALDLRRDGDWLFGDIPDDLSEVFRVGEIKSWFLKLSGGGKSQALTLLEVSAGQKVASSDLSRTTILGKVEGASGDLVELLAENGLQIQTHVGGNGHFRFDEVPIKGPLSIRYKFAGRDRYADQGRWFMAKDEFTPVSISVTPEYINYEGRPIDPGLSRLLGPQDNLAYVRYRPQSLLRWAGSPAVQEFYREVEPLRDLASPPIQEFFSITFTNSAGFLDKERFLDKREGCIRIAHIGGSSSVALQVKPFEKFNILLEQELGVRLGRCVEVISAGRDNGDLGAVYPTTRDYLIPFKADLLIIEHMQLLGLQLQPDLLAKLHGWDYEFSPLGHFVIDASGQAVFVAEDKSWPLSVKPVNRSPVIDGIPLMQTLSVPKEDLSPLAKEAYRMLELGLNAYSRLVGNVPIILQTGADQARCHQAATCGPTLLWKNDYKVSAGVSHFIKNVENVCALVGIMCLQPAIFTPEGEDENLTFNDDGHYTLRGHQWLAHELANNLEPFFR